jgi:hypothetical protein
MSATIHETTLTDAAEQLFSIILQDSDQHQARRFVISTLSRWVQLYSAA